MDTQTAQRILSTTQGHRAPWGIVGPSLTIYVDPQDSERQDDGADIFGQ